MRPGQNKRMRGRPSNNRRSPNPLTRSYESNGPDVKIRGNAQHVAEKYLQLARDAHTGGDPVAAENYLQHAEHYFRLIAAAQAAQALAQSGRPPGEAEEFDDDEVFDTLSDRFSSPSERPYQPQSNGFPSQPTGAPNAPQPYVERQPFEADRPVQADRSGFGPRQGNRFQDRGPRPDRQFGERGEGYNRQNRDGRPRDFRPYRESAQPQREGAPENAGGAELPSFITSAPRPNAEDEAQPAPAADVAAAAVETPDAQPSFPESPPAEAHFPSRGRRRRLRSPYGFNAAQSDADIQSPNPVEDESPVSE